MHGSVHRPHEGRGDEYSNPDQDLEEAAEAQRADYDIAGGTLLLQGEVLVTQGASALSADRMRVDLGTGSARMEGRVRTILTPEDG